MTATSGDPTRPRPMIRHATWAVILVLLLAACGHQSAAPSQADTPGAFHPGPASALVGAGLGGEHLDLLAYRGHPVVINFWASWCDPCRAEQPDVNALFAKYPGVQFIGVDIRDQLPGARQYVLELKVPFPSVFDPSGANVNSYGAAGIPTIVVIDGKGTVVAHYLGTVSGVSQELDALLHQKAK